MAKLRAFCWILLAICFAYDCYVWGGLKSTPKIGELLMKEAPFGTPIAATYLVIGEKVNGTIGRTEEGRAFAARKFPELVAHPENLQYLAVSKFLGAQDGWGSFCYWFAPVLLVLSLVLHWTRQKQVKSLGSQ